MTIIDTHLLQANAADELARLQRYRAAWEAYHGDFPEPLRPRGSGPHDDNVLVNYCRLIVDKGVSFLFGQRPGFELVEGTVTPEEDWLGRCWQANGDLAVLQKLATNGAVCGHAFLKLVPGGPGGFPRLIVLDPANVRVGFDPADIDSVTWYRIEYSAVDPRTGKMTAYRQSIERESEYAWQIVDQVSRSAGGSWETLSAERWPYAWPPVSDCQNLPIPNEFYGVSDLPDDVLRLNRNINFVLSNVTRILRFHAHPKTWGKGFSVDQLKVAPDETIILNNPEALLQNLEMTSDLGSSLGLFEQLREALHEVTRVPEVATGRLRNLGALSGLALQILYQPLVEKTKTKRGSYGALLVELNRRLLELGGFGPSHVGVLRWPDLLPGDPLAVRQAALMDLQMGASQDTILQMLGYDADAEREKRAAEDQRVGGALLQAFDRGEDTV